MRPLVFSIFLILNFNLVSMAATDIQVETPLGTIVGTRAKVDSFLGVPYARPPVGPLRWKDTLEVEPWTQPQVAKKFSLACPQIPIPGDGLGPGSQIPYSEDCLYLNLWRPATGEKKLAVMVWLHGGQYLRGSAYQYIGEDFAELGNVILVNFNYRLGPLGFVGHPGITSSSPSGYVGNQGITDQIMALQWIKKNIASFGGDPSKITVFGESAGAASICAMMASPIARPLFSRVILQSDWCFDDAPGTNDAYLVGKKIAKGLGCNQVSAEEQLKCMQSKPVKDVLMAIPVGEMLGTGPTHYSYHIDNNLVTQAPGEAIRTKKVNDKQFIIGTTDDEWSRFVGGYQVQTVSDYKKHIQTHFGANNLGKILNLYPAPTSSEALRSLSQLWSDYNMTCPIRRNTRDLVEAGSPAYQYRFTRVSQIYSDFGAFHGIDVFYQFPKGFFTFSGPNLNYGESDLAVTKNILNYWAEFARTGNPNTNFLPAWPSFDQNEPFLRIDKDISRSVFLKKKECDLLDTL